MLQGLSYVPLLHLRLAEMRALQELPDLTKRLLLPVIKMRPWLNSASLTRAFDRVTDSLGDGRFGLDLDETKLDRSNPRVPYVEFSRLFDENDGFSIYYETVESISTAVPVMRKLGSRFHLINRQLEHINNIGRGCFVRIDTRNPENYLRVARLVNQSAAENFVFIFDCGWREDVLSQSAICIGLINNLLDENPNFEVIVAGSSFPNSFAGRGDRFSIQIGERLLFQEVRRHVNRGDVYYGDWGSTRPPSDPVPMVNVPRIDLATSTSWNCWRSNGESYEEVAQRIVDDELWNGNLDLWGEYMIQCTADGLDPAIRSPATAAAVRINLHLNIQANFDSPNGSSLNDELVGDDL